MPTWTQAENPLILEGVLTGPISSRASTLLFDRKLEFNLKRLLMRELKFRPFCSDRTSILDARCANALLGKM